MDILLVKIGVALAALWAVVCAGLWGAQERLLFPADDAPLADPAAAGFPGYQRVAAVTADGLRLAFWARPPQTRRGVVVMFHGNAARADGSAPLLAPVAAAGYGVVLAEYRGYAGNPGAPTEAGLYEDARAAVAWARDRFPGAPLLLWGESLGTGVATFAASDPAIAPAVAAVVLDAPYTSVEEVVAGVYPWVPVRALLRHPFRSAERMAAVTAPVLVVHGEADRLIPVAHGRRMLDAARASGSRGAFLPGVAHPALWNERAGVAAPGAGMAAVLAFLDEAERRAAP